MRLKAPTFPDTRGGEHPSAPRQVRYWSLCQNNDATQRVVACAADHEILVDRKGTRRSSFPIRTIVPPTPIEPTESIGCPGVVRTHRHLDLPPDAAVNGFP